VRDAERQAPSGGIGWQGGRLATARDDARRIADELVHRGLLARAEADALEAAVASAVDRAGEMVAGGLREARRTLESLRGPSAGALDDLSARLERLERTLGEPEADGRGPGGRAPHR